MGAADDAEASEDDMGIIFLDYDGVVNTLLFEPGKDKPRYCFPRDGRVNNYQAIRWLNKLCKETDAKIVVTSTWRSESNYKECLYNGGLDKGVEVIGKTPDLCRLSRADEIREYINTHQDLFGDGFVIIDDEKSAGSLSPSRFVKCDTVRGFGLIEYLGALKILQKWRKQKCTQQK